MARKLDSRDNQEPQVSDESDPPDTGGHAYLDRRSYLKLGGVSVGVLSTPTVGARTSTTTRHGIEFEQTKNAVSDLGVDPTGETPVDEVIGEVGDGVLVQFPDGAYRVESSLTALSTHDRTRGLEGLGDNVSFVLSGETRGFLLEWVDMDGAYIGNVEFDQRRLNTCVGIRLTGNRIALEHVGVRGGCNHSDGGVPLVSHSTTARGATSAVENLVATARSSGRPVLGRPGIFVEQSHRGTLNIRDCALSGFPNTAVHADNHSGRVHVFDSQFENNAAAVRLSRGGSSIVRSEIVVDDVIAPVRSPVEDSPFRLHGLSVGAVEPAESGSITIEDTAIRVENVSGSYPAVTATGENVVEIVDCEVMYNNDSSHPVILSRSPGIGEPVGPLRVQDTVIRGDGAVDSVIVAENADGTQITDSELSMPRGDGDGIRLRESEDCTVDRTEVTVSGRSVVFGEEP